MKTLKRFFLLSIILFSASWAHALSVAEIRTEIRQAIRDNPSDGSLYRYPDPVLLNYINEAQRQITVMGDLADKTTVYILTPRTTYYNLPADLINVKQVYFTDKFNHLFELQQKAQKSLYDNNPQWESQPGIPISFWVSQATNPQNQGAAPLRISYIPVPNYLSTGTVTIWYAYMMPDLSAGTDVPFDNRRNLIPYHYAIVYHVVTRIKLRENKTTEAQAYQQFYTDFINSMKGKLGEMPDYTPGISIPGVNR